jgi:hypothetical protein
LNLQNCPFSKNIMQNQSFSNLRAIYAFIFLCFFSIVKKLFKQLVFTINLPSVQQNLWMKLCTYFMFHDSFVRQKISKNIKILCSIQGKRWKMNIAKGQKGNIFLLAGIFYCKTSSFNNKYFLWIHHNADSLRFILFFSYSFLPHFKLKFELNQQKWQMTQKRPHSLNSQKVNPPCWRPI